MPKKKQTFPIDDDVAKMLERKGSGLSMLQFYKTRLTKIERIRKNGWKLQSLIYK